MLERSSSSGYRVLIVEDEPDTGESLKVLLEVMGHRAEVARDAETGLEMLRRDGADAVLCDLAFPTGPSGLDLAARVRNDPVLYVIPLIAVTGCAGVADRQQAMNAGFDVLLVKPAEPEDILAAIGRLADRGSRLN